MGKYCMVTTVDNPYDYFEEFDKWYNYDTIHGYNTCSLLARIAKTSVELPDSVNRDEIERACDRILKIDFEGIYKKVYEKD